jgi:superfamily II DNA/RNA helicase
MVLNNSYPFEDQTYRKLVNRKIRDYEKQSQSFKEMNEEQNIKMFLNELVIYNHNTNEEIKLNELQKHDTNLMLQKKYGYLQWQQGSGKSISATAQMLYRFKHNNIKNVFLVAPAIAIKNNWAKILEHYKLPHRQINKLSDVYNIKHGEIVFMTFGMLTKYERFIKKYVTLNNSNIMFVLDEADNISSLDSKRTKSTLSTFKKSKYKLLLSGTSTRNTIDESFTAFNLLYSQSVNMLCEAEYIYVEDKKTKEIEEKYNHDYYMKPFPAYKKGHTLFKRCFVPEKSTVFGIGKTDQNIYSSDKLKKLIDKTFITRSFQEVAGKDLYKIVQNTCTFNSDEKALYKVIIEEFYKIVGMYRSTGNYRKDAILRILRQLNALLLSASLPTAFKEYRGHSTPSKAKKMIQMVKQWDNEIVSIGCTRIKTVNAYANILRKHFPHRQIFVITGESSTLQQRQDIVDKLKESKNGILICTQQSLSSSMNIDFVNRVLLVELNWNMSQMSQHFFRYIRFTSKDPKEIHFLTVANSLESNLLKLNMTKEKLNLFMKDQEIDDEELNNRFGLDFDVLEWLLSKEKDSEGNTLIRWGEQKIV